MDRMLFAQDTLGTRGRKEYNTQGIVTINISFYLRLFNTPPLPRQCNIINPQNHLHRLRRQLHRTRANKQRLQHILILHISLDSPTPNTNPRVHLPHIMSVSQIRHHPYAIQSSILRQCCRNDFHGVSEGFPANRLSAGQLS